MSGTGQLLRQGLVGGGVGLGAFAICAAIGLPVAVGAVVGVLLFLLFLFAKRPEDR